MDDEEELVAHVVAAGGGRIVGRIRLQKVFYLLDQMGMGSGFDYAYHHYGPYSAALADAVDGAKAFRYVREETHNRRSDGAPFSVFSVGEQAPTDVPAALGQMTRNQVTRALQTMNGCSATVLELAATIHWLRDELGLSNWREELTERKGQKTEAGRTDQALRLLEQLGL